MVANFYGIDWLAMVLTFISLILLGNKKRSGFLVGVAANSGWVVFSILAGSVASTFANLVVIGLSIRGYRKWKKDDETHVVDKKL